jgi:sulfate adenylyltransferase subunit 1
MDLIGYDEAAFRAIERDFSAVLDQIAADTGNPVERIFVPVSALKPATTSFIVRMRWIGTADHRCWSCLSRCPSSLDTRTAPFRFPVQRVLRPDHSFRGFAGQIASGTIRPGDRDHRAAFGQKRGGRAHRYLGWRSDRGIAPLSVTLVLDRELDISRGDLIVSRGAGDCCQERSRPRWCGWISGRSSCNRRYLLKHTSQTVPAFVLSIDHRTDMGT